MTEEINEEIEGLQQKLEEKEKEKKEIEKAQEELEELEKESKEIERAKELVKDPDKHMLLLAYLYAREFCKDNHNTKLIDKLLIKRGILKPIDERKFYKGFKGYETYQNVVGSISALLKSEVVE